MDSLPSTLLVAHDRCTLKSGDSGSVVLQVSPRALMNRHWPRGRPTPLQLEAAIDDVENAIESTGLRHRPRGILIVSQRLGQAFGSRVDAVVELSRDDVELEFSSLVRASGDATHNEEGAPNGEAAAALLLLREFMHHLGFESLRIGG